MVEFDRSITDLALLALAAIEQQLAVNPCDHAGIGRIITTAFTPLVGDPEELHRIVRAVREIVSEETKFAAR